MNTTDQTQNHYIQSFNEKRRHIRFCIVLLLFTIALFFLGTSKKPFVNRLIGQRSPSVDDSICSLKGDKWIVITTIFYPTPAIYRFLNLTTHWNLIVIGDKKTPKDWLKHLAVNTSRLLFLSFEEQNNLNFRILAYLPQGSYARKNLGYLIAIRCGAQIIFESDDDNLLETDDIYLLPKIVQPRHVPWIAFHRQRSPFINIYGSFGHPQIWPRGFPIDEIRNVTEDGWHSVRKNRDQSTYAYIQQYLADLDPDVDAIYRLGHPLSLGRIKFDRNQSPVAVESYTFSPYNTQNTVTYYEAFWGLYLPITTTFRVCDIWRGFWVQRLLWDIGGRLIFGTSTVDQIRNSHSYINDMDDEYQLYHQSGSFVRFLSSWSSSHYPLAERIAQLTRDIAEAGFWHSKEVSIMDAWLADLHSVGYTFPTIVEPSSPSPSPLIQKRGAVCVTGFAECILEGWVPTYDTISNRFQGDFDTFLFLSSSLKDGPMLLYDRLQEVRLYMNSTVSILYEDRVIDPNIPSNCPVYMNPGMDKPVDIYYQQIWALAECYDLVREYEQKMNIRYELFIRTRVDHSISKLPEILDLPNSTTVLIPAIDNFEGANDRFAIGTISTMNIYMRRWHNLSACHIENIQAEAYLKSFLKLFGVTIQLMLDFGYDQAPHRYGSCH